MSSLFDLNVGFTTNTLPVVDHNNSPPASTLPIVDRNSCFAANMFADIRPQGLQALHPVFGKCVKQLSTLHRGLGIGSEQTSTLFALSERKAKYPNKDQNTPAQENRPHFSGVPKKRPTEPE
ncbi:MAG: hypothetical protein WBK83_06390 [Dysgonamonadaceae bacterium]